MAIVLALCGCGTGFKYEYGDCLRLADPNTMIFDQSDNWVMFDHYAKVEGFGTSENSALANAYILSFNRYSTKTILWRPDYVEQYGSRVSASYCAEP
jgi:beta-glucanase (GH16 family)